MRIDDRNLTGIAAPEAGKAQETQKAFRGGAPQGTNQDFSGDHVQFSAGLDQLARAISSFGSERAAKVQHLAALYRSGGYKPDAAGASRAMVSEALHAAVN